MIESDPIDEIYNFELDPYLVEKLKVMLNVYEPGDYLRVELRHYSGPNFILVRGKEGR